MTERELDDTARDDSALRCSACGARNRAGDRFCAECGTPLPAPTGKRDSDEAPPPTVDVVPGHGPAAGTVVATEGAPAAATPGGADDTAWILGARPATVIGGGLLLLLLAVALLAIGQRDDTGTLVMLSICTAPLGLLTIAIGVARSIAGATRRG